MDVAAFEARQQKLVGMWPTIGSPTDEEKTMVVVPSVSLDIPDEIAPLLPAYEERFLFLLLLLAQPRARVIYITSQAVSERVVDYYLALAASMSDDPDLRRRLTMLSLGDPTTRPLTKKILDRPRTLARIRAAIGDPETAHLVPFATTSLEESLAVELQIPMYGAPPAVLVHGTKTGSRAIFESEGVPHPRGRQDLSSMDDLQGAIKELAASSRPPAAVVVKLNEGIGGLGNAIVHLSGHATDEEIAARVQTMELLGGGHDVAGFLRAFEAKGGVVEELIAGEGIRSPSVQMRIAPDGDVEMLSTHDQILGGETGQAFFGARFPADPTYAPTIAEEAAKVGRRLAAEGVIGRLAVDFIVVPHAAGWDAYAIEINIRKGGTTHPYLTLQLLTNGTYDPASATFSCRTGSKHYVATDHLEGPGFTSLTADDLLDLVAEEGRLGWDPKTETGIVFHMIAALPAVGRVGMTAVGSSAAHADELYATAEAVLIGAANGNA